MNTRPSRQPWFAALAAASLLSLAACGQAVDTQGGQPYQTGVVTDQRDGTAPTAASPMPPAVDTSVMGGPAAPAPEAALTGDARVSAEVKSALASDSDLGALRIDVHTADGVVTLRGSAPDPAAKERAGDVAKAMKGVRSVDNQLTLG